ncbi:MAG: HDOD domain-containing protein [Lentisphaeraceae bacterium]|nr:HDOD domain-containing protein [Lentisphaeraceae bacterium]
MNLKAKNFILSCNMPSPHEPIIELVKKLSTSQNTPQQKLIKMIAMDPVLTAKIHQLNNTSLNKRKIETGCLSKAITQLGLGQIRTLINAQKSTTTFPETITNKIDTKDFWERSLAVAICSQTIDQIVGNRSDEIFYAGLLHDYGRLIILNNADTLPVHELIQKCTDKNELIYKNERKHYGFNHMELGDALFTTWNMPSVIREPAAFHHSPILAIRHKYETAVVHIADIICRSLKLGKSTDNYIPTLDMNAVREVGLSENQLDYICEETVHELEEYMNLFEHTNTNS